MSLTQIEHFWERVNKTPTCWLWTAGRQGPGYGAVWWDGKSQLAHRVAYTLVRGDIPDGMFIDHRCHVPLCVNPEHLRLATFKENGENRLGARRDSRTGIRGVTQVGPRGWRAYVNHNGVVHEAGRFPTPEQAERAAIAARNELFTHNDRDRVA